MSRILEFIRCRRRALLIVLSVIILGVATWTVHQYWQKPDPLLTTPTIALESLKTKSLYFNNSARPWLLAQRPDLLAAEDRDADSERSRGLTQAVQNPKLFRQLDRQARFDAVLLTGDPSQYKPLLDHLIATKDWKLSYVDHTSLVFRRDVSRPWELADLATVRARLAKNSAYERATALAQTATKLLAAGQPELGKKLLDEAAQLAPRHPEVANGLAIYHLDRGEWREASAQVEKALSADGKFLPALATKTQLLYGTKRFSEAYDLSRELVAKLPQDPGLLFYHAKIAHEAHAYKAEIEALEKLVTWADFEGRPVGGYQLYLGQAYASVGDAQRSIDSFMLALNDPDLPADQRAFARENIARIKKRSGQ
jgi:tetratricopeptide (TPR) repeat protein